MKNRKPTVRRALTVTAGCAALALSLSACGAGQISQTAEQVAAVNGTEGNIGDAHVRDVTLISQPDNSVSLKFNASNEAIQMEDIVLEGISIDDASIDFDGNETIAPNCTLVADSQAALDEMNPDDADLGCTEYFANTVEGSNFYIGASRPVTFEFNTGDLEINAPVAAWYPESGQTYRHQDGVNRLGEDTLDGDHDGEPIG